MHLGRARLIISSGWSACWRSVISIRLTVSASPQCRSSMIRTSGAVVHSAPMKSRKALHALFHDLGIAAGGAQKLAVLAGEGGRRISPRNSTMRCRSIAEPLRGSG